MVEPTKVAAKADTKAPKATAAAKAPVKGSTRTSAESRAPVSDELVDAEDLEREMDRLSLEQAVRDFEIANARVIDLTQRLISVNERVVELQQELDRTHTALVELNGRHQAVLGSQAYRLADKLRTVRNLLR